MTYDFDTVIDRRGTNCLKYDFARERGMPEGLLPMWVADMDFASPPEVLDDLHKAVNHGIFGYAEAKDDYYDAMADWFDTRFGYRPERRETVKTPGVVFALAQAIRAFTEPGDAVMIQTPAYYPFFGIICDNNRQLVANPLVYDGGQYLIDFDDFEQKIKQHRVKLFLLCNPHNPVSRVYTRSELERLNDICIKNGVIVVSDEIHCDFVWDGHKHTGLRLLSDDAVIATSPSKAFNLAGLQISNIFIKNTELRKKFRAEIGANGYSQLGIIGLAACQSAYTNGAPWLSALKEYLEGNIRFASDYLASHLPKVKLVEPQGTYLLWFDFSQYGLEQDELDRRIVEDAKLWLDGGTMFGDNGKGFQRMNIACPRATLTNALNRLCDAFG